MEKACTILIYSYMHNYMLLIQTTFVSLVPQQDHRVLPKDYNSFFWVLSGQLQRDDTESEHKSRSFLASYKWKCILLMQSNFPLIFEWPWYYEKTFFFSSVYFSPPRKNKCFLSILIATKCWVDYESFQAALPMNFRGKLKASFL